MTHHPTRPTGQTHRADWSTEITPATTIPANLTRQSGANNAENTSANPNGNPNNSGGPNGNPNAVRGSDVRENTFTDVAPEDFARYSNAGADWLYSPPLEIAARPDAPVPPSVTGNISGTDAVSSGTGGANGSGTDAVSSGMDGRDISAVPPSERNARVVRISNGQMDESWPDIENNLPDDVIEAPTTMQEVYRGSMKALLLRNVGNYVVATFLIGTQTTVSWEGILYDVGNDYLAIYQSGRDQYIVSDLYSLKYVEFYDTRRRELCDQLLSEAGPIQMP